MDGSIILVGNSPSIIGKDLGSEIDEFSDVVRFNNFEIENYEIDVGTKSTILARRSCNDVKLHSPHDFESVLNFITYCRWTSAMAVYSRKVASYYGDKCININARTCKEVGEKIGLDQPKSEWASIGVLTIGYLVERYPIVHICGFDHLETNKEGLVNHYFPTKPKDSKYHSGEKEKQYVNSLIREGKVIRL